MSDAPPLEIFLLGEVDYDDLQSLQRRLVYDLGEGGGGALVLCEHPPTITVGRSGSRAHIAPDDDELRELGIRVRWVNRGGGCVLHGAGQLAAYAILPLDRLGLDVGGYLRALHHTLSEVLADFDLKGRTRTGQPGLFLGGERVATVGIAVTRWIAYHGITLNVGPYLAPYAILEEPSPGGLVRITSMEARRQRPASMARVRESLIGRFEATFGLDRHHVYTHHPLIRPRRAARVYVENAG